jgi:hypothetical protein
MTTYSSTGQVKDPACLNQADPGHLLELCYYFFLRAALQSMGVIGVLLK